jgi:hypothetical protein
MPKFNFTHLKADGVIEYPLVEFTDEVKPVLLLRSPSEGNKDYTNGILRLTGQADGGRKKKLKVDAKFMDEMREQDRELYPECVITGWKGVVDEDGVDVPFSTKACADFLSELPDWIFDGIRSYAQEPENFTKQISKEQGKN